MAVTEGVMHVAQSPESLQALRRAIEAYDPFALTAFAEMVSAGGSYIIALAVAAGRLTPEEAWETAMLDETYQAEQWGVDTEAEKAQIRKKEDFMVGFKLLNLSKA
jgi:chaperone required for assembly of F1-ATPase